MTPEPILRLASGFMSAKLLFAASELGLFEALADSPTTLDALAARTGLTRRAARISADAMVALGLLELEDQTYRNGQAAAAFLAGRGPADLRPFLRFWDKISYPTWCGLSETLAKGPSKEIFELDDELQEVASAGIEAILAGPAAALPKTFDFSRHRRLLDVGGGTGSWSIAVAQAYPHLEATVFELPAVAEIARQRIAAAGLAARIDVVAGDAMTGALPPGYDVFLDGRRRDADSELSLQNLSWAQRRVGLGRFRRHSRRGSCWAGEDTVALHEPQGQRLCGA